MGEDKLPGKSGGAADKPLEERFYPNMEQFAASGEHIMSYNKGMVATLA